MHLIIFFLSMFLGLNIVTIYGNYYYIMNAISGLLIIATTSIGAGIGNSIATESVEKNYKRLYEVYVYVCMVIWLVYGMFILLIPTVYVYMGGRKTALSDVRCCFDMYLFLFINNGGCKESVFCKE